MSDAVLYEVADQIATITLNRPERLNAWNGDIGHLYWTYLDQAVADAAVKVIIVTGAGRGFCSGADMDVLQGIGSRAGEFEDRGPRRDEHQTYTLGVPKPVIAVINGSCAGLGLVQASMADVRFAAAGAKFTTAFSRRGLIAEHGLGFVLPKLVGPSKALDLLMSARVFLAEEALELGFVNWVDPAEELMARARAYAADLAQNVSPTSMAVIKQQVWHSVQNDLAASNALSDSEMRASLKRGDFKEGVSSFLEKRPPAFAPYTV
ncbi:MAG: enoyl-CoA hydratase/isomerase family protein [Acidimicrobiales bacterium]|nr:enoyl-CoA hydratase/isomerase family protein [Acidimicrobiales bacterium]